MLTHFDPTVGHFGLILSHFEEFGRVWERMEAAKACGAVRVRNSSERMRGREQTGAGFYPGGGLSAHLSAHRGAPKNRTAAWKIYIFDLF